MKRLLLTLFMVSFTADAQPAWPTVFVCEGDEAIVQRHPTDPTRYKLTLRNEDVNQYLGLRFRAATEGTGAPIEAGGTFAAFRGNDAGVHVFADYGGLKVLVEREPYYYCEYDLHYGDSSGMTHTVAMPLGTSCPDLRPSYGFRSARAGSDVRTSKDWYFQNCRGVAP